MISGMQSQDWLLHPGVDLAAYFPFFWQAGVEEVQVRLLTTRKCTCESAVILFYLLVLPMCIFNCVCGLAGCGKVAL